ncbi:MAG: hypothetical protein ACO3PV_09140 [Pseudohongiellaceae bacterium]
MGFLEWIEGSALGVYVQEDPWGFAIALSLHAVGMATVLGIVVVTNLRVLGYVKEIPVLTYPSLFSIAWGGFGINLISGIMLYASHATEYTFQIVFMLKLGLLLVGGILMKVLIGKVKEGADHGTLKTISGLCLACWFGAVITGRLMAYF